MMEMRMELTRGSKRLISTKMILIASGILIGFVLIASWIANRPYSEGHRSGYVQKFSRKGAFFKSWEGDLALFGSARSGGSIGNVWHFSVSDPKIVEQINALDDSKPVRLNYTEYFWRGKCETAYRITKVEPIKGER